MVHIGDKSPVDQDESAPSSLMHSRDDMKRKRQVIPFHLLYEDKIERETL